MFNWSWYDMALDAISLAISPYIARANKAVEFYTTNYNGEATIENINTKRISQELNN